MDSRSAYPAEEVQLRLWRRLAFVERVSVRLPSDPAFAWPFHRNPFPSWVSQRQAAGKLLAAVVSAEEGRQVERPSR